MKLLLDTNVIIMLLVKDPRITPELVRFIEDADEVHYSAAVIWEIAIKHSTGKLSLSPHDVVKALDTGFMSPLDITPSHALLTSSLGNVHRDPFDRIQIAQAILGQMTLLTSDNLLPRYDSTGNVVRHIYSIASK